MTALTSAALSARAQRGQLRLCVFWAFPAQSSLVEHSATQLFSLFLPISLAIWSVLSWVPVGLVQLLVGQQSCLHHEGIEETVNIHFRGFWTTRQGCSSNTSDSDVNVGVEQGL